MMAKENILCPVCQDNESICELVKVDYDGAREGFSQWWYMCMNCEWAIPDNYYEMVRVGGAKLTDFIDSRRPSKGKKEMEDSKEQSKKTFIDCYKQDSFEMKTIKESLEMAIGHDMVGVEGKILYRGRWFTVKLTNEAT